MYDIEAFNNAAYGGFIMDNLAEAMGEEGTYTTMVGHVTERIPQRVGRRWCRAPEGEVPEHEAARRRAPRRVAG